MCYIIVFRLMSSRDTRGGIKMVQGQFCKLKRHLLVNIREHSTSPTTIERTYASRHAGTRVVVCDIFEKEKRAVVMDSDYRYEVSLSNIEVAPWDGTSKTTQKEFKSIW